MMINFSAAPSSAEMGFLNEKLKNRCMLDRNLGKIANELIMEWYSGQVTTATVETFKFYIYHVDQAHQALTNFIKRYLTEEDLFINENFVRQIIILKNENAKLKSEILTQKNNYEEFIKRKTNEFYEQKREAEQKYSNLQIHWQEVEMQHLLVNKVTHDSLETISKQKQQLEGNLKVQNNLIKDLKFQLEESKRNNTDLKKSCYNEQEQVLKRKHLKEIQSIREECDYKIHYFQRLVSDCNKQLHELHQHNKNLQEEASKFKNFNQDWQKLQKDFKIRGDGINNLQQSLAFFKNQNVELQREIVKQSIQIKTLNNKFQYVTAEQNHQARKKEQQDSLVTLENQKEDDAKYILIGESLRQIKNIFENAKSLEEEVDRFSGTRDDKTFTHLQELLIRNIIKLDNVETGSNFEVRKRRTEVIRYVQTLINKLKEKT